MKCAHIKIILHLAAQEIEIGISMTYFLFNGHAFNQPLTLPSGLTSIGTYFLFNCLAFTLLIYNPSVYPTDGNSISKSINSKTSINGTGIKVIGTNAAGLKAALPDRTTSPYRKLV